VVIILYSYMRQNCLLDLSQLALVLTFYSIDYRITINGTETILASISTLFAEQATKYDSRILASKYGYASCL